jgi:hypothetical protein
MPPRISPVAFLMQELCADGIRPGAFLIGLHLDDLADFAEMRIRAHVPGIGQVPVHVEPDEAA